MKTKLLITLFTFIGFFAFAQTDSTKTMKKEAETISKSLDLDKYYGGRIRSLQQAINAIDLEAKLRKEGLQSQIDEILGAVYHNNHVNSDDVVNGKIYADSISLKLKKPK